MFPISLKLFLTSALKAILTMYVYFLAGFELYYFLFYVLFVVNYITVSSMTTAAYVLLWLFSCMYRPAYDMFLYGQT